MSGHQHTGESTAIGLTGLQATESVLQSSRISTWLTQTLRRGDNLVKMITRHDIEVTLATKIPLYIIPAITYMGKSNSDNTITQ